MTPHQPVVSGRRLVKAFEADGWEVARQRGSHVRLRKPGRRLALVATPGLYADDLRRLLSE